MSESSLKGKANYFVRRKVEYIAYQTEEEVLTALVEVLVFGIFLIVTTALALNCQTSNEYYSNAAMQQLFISPEIQDKFIWQIEKLTTVENWWNFVEKQYLHKFNSYLKYPKELSTNETDPIGLHNKPLLWGANILLHPPTLRQIRVKPKKCAELKFLEKNRTCYGRYSPLDQSHEPYHKGTKYMDTDKSDIRPVWAIIETYSGGGYVVSIPPRKTKWILKSLRDKQWIDGGTRFVELTIETFNYNMGIFTSIKLITEVLPTGSIAVAFYTTVIPFDFIWTPNKPGMIFTACVFYIIVIFNTGNEIYEIKSFGIRNYFKVIWNYIDWGIIITAYISLGFSITHPLTVKKFLDDIENGNELASLDTVDFYDTIYLGAISLCTLQLWIRLFRFITFNATMMDFNKALTRCAPEIFAFALIFLIFLAIFSFFGILRFGDKQGDFATFNDAFFFMFRLMLHDFNYSSNFTEVSLWGPLYLLCYFFIVVCILVNMFLAIISQTYMDVKHDADFNSNAIKTAFLNLKFQINDVFTRLRKKLKFKSKSNLEAVPSQKKVQFAEEPDLPETQADVEVNTEESSRKRISVHEDPKNYIKIRPEASITSLLDSVKSDDMGSDEEEIKLETTNEFLSGLTERLNRLKAGFKQLGNNMDDVLAKLEGKLR